MKIEYQDAEGKTREMSNVLSIKPEAHCARCKTGIRTYFNVYIYLEDKGIAELKGLKSLVVTA